MLRIAPVVGANNIRIFGSVLHREDQDRSDLDLLVDMPRRTTLVDMARLEAALEDELGVSVHVLTAGDLPPNCRDHVLEEAVSL